PQEEKTAEEFYKSAPTVLKGKSDATKPELVNAAPAPPPPPPLPPAPVARDISLPVSRRASTKIEPSKPAADPRSNMTSIAEAVAAAALARTQHLSSSRDLVDVQPSRKSLFNLADGRETRPLTNGRRKSDPEDWEREHSRERPRPISAKSDISISGKTAAIAAASAGILARNAMMRQREAKEDDLQAGVANIAEMKPESRRLPADLVKDIQERSVENRRSVPDFPITEKESSRTARRSLSNLADLNSTAAFVAEPESVVDTPRSRKSSRLERSISTPIVDKEVESARLEGSMNSPAFDDDYYAQEAAKKRKSKRASEIFDDFDPSKSTASMPGTKDEDSKSRRRSKKHSKDDYEDDIDETRSVASTTVLRDDDRRSKRKSSRRERDASDDDDARSVKSSTSKSSKKDKEKESSKSGGFFSNIFSRNQTDVSTPSRKGSRSSRSERRPDDSDGDNKHRRKHGSKSSASASVPDLTKVKDSTDDSFASAKDDQSFLGIRPDMPSPTATTREGRMDTDGVSGLKSTDDEHEKASISDVLPAVLGVGALATGAAVLADRRNSKNERSEDDAPTVDDLLHNRSRALSVVQPEVVIRAEDEQPDINDLLSNHPRALSVFQPEASGESDAETVIEAPASVKSEESVNAIARAEQRPRALSMLQDNELPRSPGAAGSPTSKRVPLFFRRPPITRRSNIHNAASSPVLTQAPGSPLSAPRTRQNRPKSTEFASREFRPLYLVQRHTPVKEDHDLDEEDLPALPSSRNTSV
ncbi:hypothetical protein LTR66_016640, partial [Elasticomyces elasticus]